MTTIDLQKASAVWGPAVLVLGLATAAASQPSTAGQRIILDTQTIEMTCFPPPVEGGEPGIGPPPPCVTPADLDPKFNSPNPSGRATLMVAADGTTRVSIVLQGLAPDLVVTAWLAYYFPPNPPEGFPIFQPIGAGMPPVAGIAVPLAATDAAFTEGLGWEPNRLQVHRDRAWLNVVLDYDPLRADAGPLRNELTPTNQSAAPVATGAAQPNCCPNALRPQPIGASFLREFDRLTGLPVIDHNGRPVLLRSPVPAVVIALVVHIDATTHGISAGIPIPPVPGASSTTGDHYTLGLFDLRAFHR